MSSVMGGKGNPCVPSGVWESHCLPPSLASGSAEGLILPTPCPSAPIYPGQALRLLLSPLSTPDNLPWGGREEGRGSAPPGHRPRASEHRSSRPLHTLFHPVHAGPGSKSTPHPGSSPTHACSHLPTACGPALPSRLATQCPASPLLCDQHCPQPWQPDGSPSSAPSPDPGSTEPSQPRPTQR